MNRCVSHYGGSQYKVWLYANYFGRIMITRSFLWSVGLFLAVSVAAYSLEVRDFQISDESPDLYNKIEFTFNLDREFGNPFDPDEISIDLVITQPSGKVRRAAAFYTRDYEHRQSPVEVRTLRGDTKVVELHRYESLSEGYWKVRYAAKETGLHEYYLEIKSAGGAERYPASGQMTFEGVPSDKPGYLRVDPRNHHYLTFEDGTSFFGIGFNAVNTMGACNEGKVRSFEFLQKTAAQNGNIMQIDLCQGDYLEWTPEENRLFQYYQDYAGLGWYNLKVASDIDSVISMAERLGIYLRISFYHWGDFYHEPADGAPGFAKNPYFQRNGGPCRTPMDFFNSREAWEYQKKVFRYIIARWGYSSNIVCWELWNEVDNVPDFRLRDAVKWHNKAISFIKEIDPEHLITTSTISYHVRKILAEHLDEDIVTYHEYVSYNPDRPFRIVENLQRSHDFLSSLKKPIIAGEFGYEAHAGFGNMLDLKPDSLGVDIHNQFWSSLMVGDAATAMAWRWESHIDRYCLYHHCQGISKFLENEELPQARSYGDANLSIDSDKRQLNFPEIWTPTREEKERGMRSRAVIKNKKVKNAQALGLISKNRALIWVKDAGYAWFNYAPLEKVKNVKLKVKGMGDGPVQIEYWNTFSGEITATEKGLVKKGKIEIVLPDFYRDIALKIYPDNVTEPAQKFRAQND